MVETSNMGTWTLSVFFCHLYKITKVTKIPKFNFFLVQKTLQSEFIFSFIVGCEDKQITELEECACIEAKIVMITFTVAKK